MDPNDYSDIAFDERAHDPEEEAESVCRYFVEREGNALIIGVDDEPDGTVNLLPRAQVFDFIEECLDRGGCIRVERDA